MFLTVGAGSNAGAHRSLENKMMGPITCGVELFMSGAPDWDLEVARSRKTCLAIMHAMVAANIWWYRCYPNTPTLYKSNIIYREEPPGQESFDSIQLCLKRGWGDCDDLSAIRCANLNEIGIAATPYLKWRDKGPNQNIYHAVVRLPDGRIEDPSLALGMAGHEITRAPLYVDEGPAPKFIRGCRL